jgi:hypothetical protein
MEGARFDGRFQRMRRVLWTIRALLDAHENGKVSPEPDEDLQPPRYGSSMPKRSQALNR